MVNAKEASDAELRTMKAADFWDSQIQNLRRRYNKFCQENTYLTV